MLDKHEWQLELAIVNFFPVSTLKWRPSLIFTHITIGQRSIIQWYSRLLHCLTCWSKRQPYSWYKKNDTCNGCAYKLNRSNEDGSHLVFGQKYNNQAHPMDLYTHMILISHISSWNRLIKWPVSWKSVNFFFYGGHLGFNKRLEKWYTLSINV